MTAACRPYEPADRAAVRHICNETGHLGDPIDPYFSDREVFADLHSLYYTDVENDSSFVIEDDGDVIGYLLGCLDSGRYRAWVKSNLEPHILKRGLTRGVLVRPGTAPLVWRFALDWLREKPHFGNAGADYPAHLHINLLPAGRKRGLGGLLIENYFELLRAKDLPGVFLETTAENANAVAFFASQGFLEDEKFLAPGVRAADGSRLHGLRMLRKLPGAQVV